MKLLKKEAKANLQRSYGLNMEIGLIAALLMFIILFRVDLRVDRELDFDLNPPEPVVLDDIRQTDQMERPAPPPHPRVAVDKPEDVISEETRFDLEYDLELNAYTDFLPADHEDESDTEPFIAVEEMPEPIGGIRAIYENLYYPEPARQVGIEGRVSVEFTVDIDGTVRDVKVLRGIGGGADEAAVHAIKETKWLPGRQRGRAVPVRFVYSVQFRLSN